MDNKRPLIISMDLREGELEFALSIETAIVVAREEIERIEETVESVGRLKPDCDKIDYALAAGSGALCGLIDVFLVGKPGETPVGEASDSWFEKRVEDFAKLCGWDGKGDDTRKAAIDFLEKKFDMPYDQTGRGIANEIYALTPENHHFKSLGHNPTLMGLFFSILDQFTNQSHFVTESQLIALQHADDGFELRGNGVPAKIFCGFANWFGHLVSDVSGSKGSKGRGMGIPSPVWAWVNDVIAIRRTLRISPTEFDSMIGELSMKVFRQGFDTRFQAAQLVPVLVNEAVVRLLYALRRAVKYFSATKGGARSFSEMWEMCEPFSNPTVKRMLTVAHGTFCMLDVGDAAIRAFGTGAGTFNATEFFLRFNIAGVGRFAISLYGETARAISLRSAAADADFALREKTIVDGYLSGLLELANLYDDEKLVDFVGDFKRSDMYLQAFEKSVRLAEMRKVNSDKILRTKSDIDGYFAGGGE